MASSCVVKDKVIDTLKDKGIISTTDNGQLLITNTIEFDKLNNNLRTILNSKYKKLNLKENLFDSIFSDDFVNKYAIINEKAFEEVQTEVDKNGFDFSAFINSEIQTDDDLIIKTKFDDYIEYKNYILSRIDDRLTKIKSLKTESNITQDSERLTVLLKEENDLEKLKISIFRDLKLLKDNREATSLWMAAQSELSMAENLLNYSDPSTIAFAKNIFDFYASISLHKELSTQNTENPLFDENIIYDEDGNILLPTSIISAVDDIVQTANKLKRKLYLKDRERFKTLIDQSEEGKLFVEATGKEFNVTELLYVGATDILSVDSLLFDVTMTLGSTNLVDNIPKIAHSIYQKEHAIALAYSRHMHKRLTDAGKAAEKRLKELGYTHGSFLGVAKMADYNPFLEIDEKTGYRTNNLIRAFTSKYFDIKRTVDEKYKSALDDYLGKKINYKVFQRAKKAKRNWYRNNVEVLNPALLLDEKGKPLVFSKEFYPNSKLDYTQEEREQYVNRLKQQIGETTYFDIINEQKALINEYEMTLSLKEESDRAKSIKFQNPIAYAITQYNIDSISEQRETKYTVAIPLKNKIEFDRFGKPISTEIETGYYDKFFTEINKKGNEALLDFYKLATEVISLQKSIGDPDLNNQLGDFSLMRVEKGLIEILSDPNLSTLAKISKFFRELYERSLMKLGKSPRQNLSQMKINPYTGKPMYGISLDWLKTNQNLAQSKARGLVFSFVDLIQNDKSESPEIYFNKFFDISKNQAAIDELTEILGVTDISECPWINLKNVNIYQEVYQATLNNMTMEQSMDLPRVLSMYCEALSIYQARTTVLTDMNIIRNFYRDIPLMSKRKKSPIDLEYDQGNDIIYEAGIGIRTYEIREQAVKKFDSWFFTNILDVPYDDDKIFDVPQPNSTPPTGLKKFFNKINPQRNNEPIDLKNIDEKSGKEIYSDLTGRTSKQLIRKKDKQFRTNLDNALKTIHKERLRLEESLNSSFENEDELEKTKKQIKTFKKAEQRVIASRDNLGVVVNGASVYDAVLNFVRYIGLGFNFISQINNFLDGQTANKIIASNDRYITKENLLRANRIMSQSMLKFVSFGKLSTPNASKTRILMDRYDVLQDMSNEFRRSHTKSFYSKIEKITDPFALIQRIEYTNQFPLMVAMLMGIKITGKDGTQSSVWDAMDYNGQLKENFRTEENINTWENMSNEEYANFQGQLSQLIVSTHGDYSQTRGNRSNYQEIMRATMMFKRWFPRQMANRYQSEQYDFDSGKMVKGRYHSLNYGTFGFYVFIMSAIPNGLGTGLFSAGVGSTLFRLLPFSKTANGKPISKTGTIIGDMGTMLLDTTKQLFNTPLELLTGKTLFQIKTGKLQSLDAQNYIATIHEMVLQCFYGILMTIAQALTKPDDDDDDDVASFKQTVRFLTSNILMNQMNQLTMYFNPVAIYNQIFEQPGAVRFAINLFKMATATEKAINGDDIYKSGPDAGKSRWWKQFSNTFLPSIARGKLGFDSITSREYEKWGFSDYFKSDNDKIKEAISSDKSKMQRLINKNDDLSNEEKDVLLKQIDRIFTKSRDETRKEQKERIDNYFEQNDDVFNLPDETKKDIMSNYSNDEYKERKAIEEKQKERQKRIEQRRKQRQPKERKQRKIPKRGR